MSAEVTGYELPEKCRECGGATEPRDVYYCPSDNGPHIDPPVRIYGYEFDVGELYGDWEDPGVFFSPGSLNRRDQKRYYGWMNGDRVCCVSKYEPEVYDEAAWCEKCQRLEW